MFDLKVYWVEFLDAKGIQQDEAFLAHSDAEACQLAVLRRKADEVILHVLYWY